MFLKSLVVVSTLTLGAVPTPAPAPRWGSRGHEMAARAAVSVLPTEVPDFFRAAADRLVYLNPEPDRWRTGGRPEMRAAWAPDHYVNFENIPGEALEATDRYAYIAALQEAGIRRPDQRAGFLPFTIVERYQRLVTEWELWRRESNRERRSWIEARIIDDAGILGHFVTDGSQPLHATIHYNGWASGESNPAGYTRDRSLHSRFETEFVDRHVTQRAIDDRLRAPRSLTGGVRAEVFGYLSETLAQVDELYRLERDVGFDPEGAGRRETVDFAADRLAAGAQMLAVLWLSAWEESGRR